MAYTYWDNDQVRAAELKNNYDYTESSRGRGLHDPLQFSSGSKIWLGRA